MSSVFRLAERPAFWNPLERETFGQYELEEDTQTKRLELCVLCGRLLRRWAPTVELYITRDAILVARKCRHCRERSLKDDGPNAQVCVRTRPESKNAYFAIRRRDNTSARGVISAFALNQVDPFRYNRLARADKAWFEAHHGQHQGVRLRFCPRGDLVPYDGWSPFVLVAHIQSQPECVAQRCCIHDNEVLRNLTARIKSDPDALEKISLDAGAIGPIAAQAALEATARTPAAEIITSELPPC